MGAKSWRAVLAARLGRDLPGELAKAFGEGARAAADEPAAFPLGHAAPDAVSLPGFERVFETLLTDRALSAQRKGLGRVVIGTREEEGRIGSATGGPANPGLLLTEELVRRAVCIHHRSLTYRHGIGLPELFVV